MSWADAVTALSTAIIALVAMGFGVTWLYWMREMRGLQQMVERMVNMLDQDARPAMQSVRTMADDASKVVASVRGEIDGVLETSHDVRDRLNGLVGRVEERLVDLDALVDVLHYEVEETALDVAAETARTPGATVRDVDNVYPDFLHSDGFIEPLLDTLSETNWNRFKAAKLLGVSYKTLLNRIEEVQSIGGNSPVERTGQTWEIALKIPESVDRSSGDCTIALTASSI